MTPTEFRATLGELDLRQVEFARLIAHLSGQPLDPGTVNRWAAGRRAVPSTVIAFLNIWTMVPTPKREQILEFIRNGQNGDASQ